MRTSLRWLPLALAAACDQGTITVLDDAATGDTVPDPAGGSGDVPGGGDAPPDDGGGSGAQGDGNVAPLGDLSQRGPLNVQVEAGRFPMDGCDMAFRRFTPDGPSREAVVLLVHGWMRSDAQMVGWARHLASWGYVVLTPSLCHANLLDTNHAANAAELARLVDVHLGDPPVVLIGHSAGGLASVLAAPQIPGALGVLGLDLVDSEGLGLGTAPQTDIPVWGLVGEPSWACNADGNGIDVFDAAPDGRALSIADANHCDFENPTDNGCTSVCAWQFPAPAFTDRQQRDAIAALMTGFVLGATGDDLRGWGLWTPGQPTYDALAATGVIRGG